jgi:KamA family protein
MTYLSFGTNTFRKVSQIGRFLPQSRIMEIDVASRIYPFKVNNYVIDELIDWDNWINDSIFALTFPSREMLKLNDFAQVQNAIRENWSKDELSLLSNSIRMRMNPNPAGQMNLNVPSLNGMRLQGLQHKYDQTVLFFPSQGQTCHAYCTFCFRWPQFTGIDEIKFAMNETHLLIEYLKSRPEITDVLITGGDPLSMSSAVLGKYIKSLLIPELSHIQTIRIGTKALSYWPYRFLTDKDSDELIGLFRLVSNSGKQLALMAHINHPKELQTAAVRLAIERIQESRAIIRTQSPLMKHINDSSRIWSEMWTEQVRLGLVPYYMFMARDTGAQDYFAVPLAKAFEIFRVAYCSVSGLARTVRGPSMSTTPGKIQIVGIATIKGEKVFVLNFIQARKNEWVEEPFFAKYDENAIWFDELLPAFDETSFFFEKIELEEFAL